MTIIPRIEHKINIEYSILKISKIFKYFTEIANTKIPDIMVKDFMNDDIISIL